MSKGKRRYLTLQEVRLKIQQLELRCERLPVLYGYSPSDLITLNKALITQSTSLSLVFLQHALLVDALALLGKALKADQRLFASGGEGDWLWAGRLTTFNNLAYLFQK
jgi:hypothetical protein